MKQKEKFNIKEALIRKAIINDVNTLVKIERESYGKHHWSEQTFINELNNSCSNYFVFLHKRFNKIIGYVGYWKLKNEGHITTLAVAEDFRGLGIADILLYFLINHAIKNSVTSLTLEVRVSNVPAIALYKKHGFNEFGIRKKYYQDNNEDALILWIFNIGINYRLKGNEPHADILQYSERG